MPALDFSNEERERIYSVKTTILNELSKRCTVKQVARMAALGEQKLQDGFYHFFGYRVGSYVKIAKMQTARFLLHKTEKTLKEIAAICGYKKYKSFLMAYKRHFGVSPGAVRRCGQKRSSKVLCELDT